MPPLCYNNDDDVVVLLQNNMAHVEGRAAAQGLLTIKFGKRAKTRCRRRVCDVTRNQNGRSAFFFLL